MKKLLNVLYITSQGAFLSLEGETIVVSVKGEKVGQIPLLNLQGIVCFGNVLCTPFLMGACADHGVSISFLTANGRFLARVQGGVTGNVLLRRSQFLVSEEPSRRSRIASMFLFAKVLNSRTNIQRFLRDYEDVCDEQTRCKLEYAVKVMKRTAGAIEANMSTEDFIPIEELMGLEGATANLYFSCFPALILKQKESFAFRGRTRHPPLDKVNALLSFAYTLLAHDCVGALESVGLDPQFGFLHSLRPGRPALALDLMEEFRASLADRLVLSLINRFQINAADFKTTETGAVRMNEESRKTLIEAWQERKQEEIVHPFLREKMKIGLLPYAQALILARYLRGDIEDYPPFISR